MIAIIIYFIYSKLTADCVEKNEWTTWKNWVEEWISYLERRDLLAKEWFEWLESFQTDEAKEAFNEIFDMLEQMDNESTAWKKWVEEGIKYFDNRDLITETLLAERNEWFEWRTKMNGIMDSNKDLTVGSKMGNWDDWRKNVTVALKRITEVVGDLMVK
jgi:hypothetical protein